MNKNLVKVGMPIFEGKKVYNVGVKVNKAQQDELQKICDELDRPMSYVVRELAMRGLALYKQDGHIRMTEAEESAVLRTMQKDTESREMSKEQIRAQLGFNVKDMPPQTNDAKLLTKRPTYAELQDAKKIKKLPKAKSG